MITGIGSNIPGNRPVPLVYLGILMVRSVGGRAGPMPLNFENDLKGKESRFNAYSTN